MTTFFKIIRYKMYSYRVLYVTLQPKRWTFPISRVVYRGPLEIIAVCKTPCKGKSLLF